MAELEDEIALAFAEAPEGELPGFVDDWPFQHHSSTPTSSTPKRLTTTITRVEDTPPKMPKKGRKTTRLGVRKSTRKIVTEKREKNDSKSLSDFDGSVFLSNLIKRVSEKYGEESEDEEEIDMATLKVAKKPRKPKKAAVKPHKPAKKKKLVKGRAKARANSTLESSLESSSHDDPNLDSNSSLNEAPTEATANQSAPPNHHPQPQPNSAYNNYYGAPGSWYYPPPPPAPLPCRRCGYSPPPYAYHPYYPPYYPRVAAPPNRHTSAYHHGQPSYYGGPPARQTAGQWNNVPYNQQQQFQNGDITFTQTETAYYSQT